MKKKHLTGVLVVLVAAAIVGCGTKSTATIPETSAVTEASQPDLDAIVEKKVQEQLEIDRRVKESVEAAKAQETESLPAPSTVTIVPPTTAANPGTYLLSFSDIRLVTDADLAKLSKSQLRLARNEIFARHGRKYETEDLNQYFSAQGWYQPTVTSDQWNDSVFSSIESQNVERIANYEKNGSVEIKPMLLVGGAYSYNNGDKTYYVVISSGLESGIFMHSEETDPRGHGIAWVHEGYFSPNDDGTFTEHIQDYLGDDTHMHMGQTFMMVENGFKDTQTGQVYVYSPN